MSGAPNAEGSPGSARHPLRVALVGCGDIATTGHLPALHRSRDALLVGVVDVDRESRETAAGRYGVPGWDELRRALAHDLDAVVIAVPPHVAPTLTLEAIGASVDVLCEKPMAIDVRSAEKVAAACAATGQVVQIGFKNRFSPLVEAVHIWLRTGRIGAPVAYTVGGFDERYDPQDTIHTGRIQHFLAHGPSFVHEGAHLADYLAYLSESNPVLVQAVGLRSSVELPSENFVSALVKYANGDVARLEVGWMFPTSPGGEFRVLGPRGVALVDRPGQVATLVSREEDGNLETEQVVMDRPWNDECFDRQLAHFVDCVRRRVQPDTGVHAGVASLRLGLAVVEAIRSERPQR